MSSYSRDRDVSRSVIITFSYLFYTHFYGSEAWTEADSLVQALDQDVVNKIAAGEIIVAPVHALKELIENAVDAGSTLLEILVKDGGLKMLQITDNGHGISVSSSPTVTCEIDIILRKMIYPSSVNDSLRPS